MNITVLGAGLVGSAMVKDLAQEDDFCVTVVDVNPAALDALIAEVPVQTVCVNVREPGRVAEVVADADLVVCAVPGFMGFETLRRIIEAGKNVVDTIVTQLGLHPASAGLTPACHRLPSPAP